MSPFHGLRAITAGARGLLDDRRALGTSRIVMASEARPTQGGWLLAYRDPVARVERRVNLVGGSARESGDSRSTVPVSSLPRRGFPHRGANGWA
jgi:hypothetical protein